MKFDYGDEVVLRATGDAGSVTESKTAADSKSEATCRAEARRYVRGKIARIGW
jgi:hypothetical protein